MKKNLIRSKKELNRKLLQPCQESINRYERQLKMIKCCSKMKSSQLSLLKENFGQTLRSHAVWPLNPKDLFITNAQHLRTLLVVKKDSHYNLLVRVLDQRPLSHYQSGILVTYLSILNILTKLQLKTKEISIVSTNSFHMKLLLDQNSNFQRQKGCLVLQKTNESLSISTFNRIYLENSLKRFDGL